MASGSTAGGFRNIDEERFDFSEAAHVETSTFNTSLSMVQTIALSRPFLLAVIGFLVYRLWVVSKTQPQEKKSGISVIDGSRASVQQERVSLRKSHRPSMLPHVTMAGKR